MIARILRESRIGPLPGGRVHSGRKEHAAKLGQPVLPVDPGRAAAYDSVTAPEWRTFRFDCAGCGEGISIDVASYSGRYEDPETVLGAESGQEVLRHFELRHDRSLADGWPKLRTEACSCGARYLVCAMEREPRNGWVRIALRGITRIVEAEPGAA